MTVSKMCRALVLLAVVALPNLVHAQGLQALGIGPVNRSMGGAATAAPIESIGALVHNPATLTGLANQLNFAAEVATPLVDIASTVGGPLSNRTDSSSGWTTVPAVGLAWRPQPDLPVTFGIGLYGLAGYTLNYPARTTNPILTAPPGGFGNIYADVSFLQIAPAVAVELTDHLSFGFGPTVMAGRLIASPFAFATPNTDGTYPTGAGTKYAWGLGFQTGVYWKGSNGLNWGASFKSPQWFQDFKSSAINSDGTPRDLKFEFDYPLIVSLGTSYSGIERLLLACDVRYFNWAGTPTLGDTAQFATSGQLLGLGWKDTWSVGVGAQYEATEILTVRAGYTYAQSPINSAIAGFNVGSPLILQHAINVGSSLKLAERLITNLTYYYSPQSEVGGLIQTPGGPLPGSNVNYRVSAHAITVGMTVLF